MTDADRAIVAAFCAAFCAAFYAPAEVLRRARAAGFDATRAALEYIPESADRPRIVREAYAAAAYAAADAALAECGAHHPRTMPETAG